MITLGHWSPLAPEEVVGSQKALLLGPSLGSTHRAWSRALAFIGEDIKPVVFDLPGHGLSAVPEAGWSISDLADAVVRLADSLELRQFSYGGISLSGAVGLELAIRYPDRLSSVAVLSSAPKIGTLESWQQRQTQVLQSGMGPLVEPTLARWFTPGFSARRPEVVAEFGQMLSGVDPHAYAQACQALAEFDVWDRISEIEIPTLIVHGSDDPVTSWADAQRMNELVSDSGLIQISGASHQVIAEAPEVAIKHVSFYARKYR